MKEKIQELGGQNLQIIQQKIRNHGRKIGVVYIPECWCWRSGRAAVAGTRPPPRAVVHVAAAAVAVVVAAEPSSAVAAVVEPSFVVAVVVVGVGSSSPAAVGLPVKYNALNCYQYCHCCCCYWLNAFFQSVYIMNFSSKIKVIIYLPCK